jgi:hypothetical protein
VIPFSAEHDDARALGQVDESGLQLRDQAVADGVAFGRPVQPHLGDAVGVTDLQQIELGQQTGGGTEALRHGESCLIG